MPPSADPLRLQIKDRVVTVLKNIEKGDNYFYSPYAVENRFIHWQETTGTPVYMVFTDSGGTVELSGAPDLYDEDFYINVKGIGQGEEVEKMIRDIRKAINDDSKSGTAGTLGTLAVETRIEESPETDNGYLSLEGYCFFDQRIRVKISGDYGEL